MIGWDIAVYTTGTVEREPDKDVRFIGEAEHLLRYIPPTPLGLLDVTPVELREVAVETISLSGYPSILRVRVGDLPYTLSVPDDDVVYVVAWDQS